MSIVWPCSLPVDAYSAAGKDVEVPRAQCPDCSEPMAFWSGYSRSVRHEGGVFTVWVPRGMCAPCAQTHALLPAFCLRNRLDSVETIGAVLEAVAEGPDGVRPVAERHDVLHTTARGWVRRFSRHAPRLAVALAALGVELGGEALTPSLDPTRFALRALSAAFHAATALPGWRAVGPWRFASSVGGGSLLCTNTNSPWLIVGKRRFMPPVP